MKAQQSSESNQQFPMSPFNTDFDVQEQLSNPNAEDRGSRKANSQRQPSNPRQSNEAKNQLQSLKIQPKKEIQKNHEQQPHESLQKNVNKVISSQPMQIGQTFNYQTQQYNIPKNQQYDQEGRPIIISYPENAHWKGNYSFRIPDGTQPTQQPFIHQGIIYNEGNQGMMMEPPRIFRQNERVQQRPINNGTIISSQPIYQPQVIRKQPEPIFQSQNKSIQYQQHIRRTSGHHIIASKPIHYQQNYAIRNPVIFQQPLYQQPRHMSPQFSQQRAIHPNIIHQGQLQNSQQYQNNQIISPYQSQTRVSSVSNTKIWENKFVIIYQKFLWFIERHQNFRKQIAYLNEQLDMVNSEEEWIELKRRHGQLLDRFTQVEEQLVMIIRQNRQLIEKIQNSGGSSFQQIQARKQSSDNFDVSRRFEELLTSFKILQEEYNKLRERSQAVRQLETKHIQLTESYRALQIQYKKVIIRLQQMDSQPRTISSHEDKKKLDEAQKYIIELQQYIKQIEKQHVDLQSQLKKKPSNQSSVDKSQVDKFIEMLKQKDNEINRLKNQFIQKQQKFEEEILQKMNQIESLKNSLKKQQMNHKDQLQQQIQQLELEIKNSVVNLEKRTKQLEEQLRKKVQQKEQIKNSLQFEINSLNQQLDRKNNQSQKIFKELEEKITQLEQQVRKKATQKDSTMKMLNNRIAELEDQLTRKNFEIIRPLSDKNIRLEQEINQKSIQLSKYRQGNQYLRHQSQMRKLIESQQKKNQQINKFKREKERIMEQYQQLQKDYQNLMIDYNKKKMEVNMLKRQSIEVNSYQQQLKSLNEILQKKNHQLFELKTSYLQSDNLKNQLNSSFATNEKLNQTIKNKNKQISNYKETIFTLQQKIRELSSQVSLSTQVRTPKQLQEEIQYFQDLLKKKEQEILKMRQNMMLKDTNIEELQLQKDKYKNKINIIEKSFDQQRQQWKRKINNLQADSERKVKHLQQICNQIKISSQQQTTLLRNQFKTKLDMLSQFDNNQKQFKNKITNIQKQKNGLQLQLQNYLKKIKQLQIINRQLLRKEQILNEQIQNKQSKLQQLKNNDNSGKQQVKIAKTKVIELQSLNKTKQISIKTLQQQLKQLNDKYKNLKSQQQSQKNKYIEQIQKNDSQITLLNQKILSYENKLINMHQFNNIDYKMKDFTANQIFQQRIIYQLKTQNQRLRQQLGQKGIAFNKILTNAKQNTKQKSPVKSQKHKHQGSKSKLNVQQNQVGITYIQKRLYDFNIKLQELITENRENQMRTSKISQKQLKNNHEQLQQILQQFENEKKTLLNKHNNQINLFKVRIQQLQKYCNILELRIKNEKSQTIITKNSKITIQQENMYAEQLNFYRQKNKQLQERVDRHITVNNQLKQRLQSLIKSGANNASLIYFKQQVQSLQQNIEDLNNKIKKLTDQNRQLKNEVGNYNNKAIQTYQIKVVEYQTKIQQLNRRISQLTLEKTMVEDQKKTLINDINMVNSELYKLKISANSQFKQSNYQLEAKWKQVNQQNRNYEIQISKYLNKNKILESQVQRLNQNQNKKILDINNQNQKLKIRISELQDGINRYQLQIQHLNQDKSYLQKQVRTQIERVQEYQIQMDKLNQAFSNQSKQNNTGQVNRLNNNIRILEEQLKRAQIQFNSFKKQSFSSKQKFDQQITNLQQQNQQLVNQINKLNNDKVKILNQLLTTKETIRNIEYSMEFIRSNFIESDAMFGELRVVDNDQMIIAERFKTNIQRGLQKCSQIGGLILTI